MRYLGSNFSIVLGAWRLRVSFALEDDVDDAPEPVTSRRNCSDTQTRRISMHRS